MDWSHLSDNELAKLLSQPTILSRVCSDLTFEELVQLKSTLRLNVLNCSVAIHDEDHRINTLPRVDDGMINVYKFIKELGSSWALLQSITDQNDELTIQLLNLGADIEKRNQNGSTPLAYAIIKNNPKLVKELLDRGANFQARSNDQSTSLILAVAIQSEEIVRFLLEKAQNHPNLLEYINAQESTYGNTALAYSLYFDQSSRFEIAKLLLAFGANIEIRSHDGNTVLNYLAIMSGKQDAINFLLDNGANIETQNNDQQTPLSRAAQTGKEVTVKTLLDHGANIDTRDASGRTPLMLAAIDGNLEMVKILIEHGADSQLTDHLGRTAQNLADRFGRQDIVDYLTQL